MQPIGTCVHVCPTTKMRYTIRVWATYDEMGEAEFVQYVLPHGDPILRRRSECITPMSKDVLKYADECVIMDEVDEPCHQPVAQFTHSNRRYSVVYTDGCAVVRCGGIQIGEPFAVEDATTPLECAALAALLPYSDLIQQRLLMAGVT